MMSLEVREATEKDLSSILSLYAQPEMDDGTALSLAQAEEIFAMIRCYPDYRLYVAVVSEEIVGVLSLLLMDNLAHLGAPSAVIEDVAVAPNWQRKGVGRQMMGFALKICGEKGCYKAALSSSKKRDVAHSFYESLGFRKHGYSFFVDLPWDGHSCSQD